MNPQNLPYIKAMSVILYMQAEKLKTQGNETFDISVEMISALLEIDESKFTLMLDLIGGDPIKIFACNSSNPRINSKNWSISAKFEMSRTSTLSDVLKLN